MLVPVSPDCRDVCEEQSKVRLLVVVMSGRRRSRRVVRGQVVCVSQGLWTVACRSLGVRVSLSASILVGAEMKKGKCSGPTEMRLFCPMRLARSEEGVSHRLTLSGSCR